MSVYADRVQEITTTNGTGTVDLGGAVTGYQTFANAFTSNTVVYYCITDGTEWEVGHGTFTVGSPSTISRSTVLSSSNAGGLVDFTSPVMNIFCTLPAAMVGGNASYDFIQTSPSLNWIVNHNLGYFPTVSIFDTGGNVVDAQVQHISINQAILTFTSSLAGIARFN